MAGFAMQQAKKAIICLQYHKIITVAMQAVQDLSGASGFLTKQRDIMVEGDGQRRLSRALGEGDGQNFTELWQVG